MTITLVQSPPRPLPIVLAEVRRVPCPTCRAQAAPCVTGSLSTTGQHVDRCHSAFKAELITEAELFRVIGAAEVFVGATVVFSAGGAS
jgi:hypothetical protein